MRGKYRFLPMLMAMFLLAGCGAKTAANSTQTSADGKAADVETELPAAEEDENFVPYEAPAALYPEFHTEHAQGEDGLYLDLEHMNEGYIAVSVSSDSIMKLQVLKDDETYTYALDNSGGPDFFPVQCGDGAYTVRLMQNVTDNRYAEVQTYEITVTMEDSLTPYLYPSNYVNYTADSECVALAEELASHESDEIGVISAIYDYVCENITYDDALAATVQDGYMPDVDEVLASGTGICFDYASLAAAMLRSQGIPTKVIFGYVAPNDIYHAWNMFYTEETGWVTVDFQVDTDTWNRMDLTFAANGADETFIGDGTNYTDVYFY